MDRAFDQLEEAFFRSGAVLSVETCTEDPKGPSRPPVTARGSGPIMPGGAFYETVQLGLKGTVELGGYFTGYVIDAPEDAEDFDAPEDVEDYEELSLDIDVELDLAG